MSTIRLKWAAGFYWVGVAATLACIGLVAAGSTEAVHRFEHTSFPLSWALAGIAMIAFLAAELSRSEKKPASAAKDRVPQPVREPEAVPGLAIRGVRGRA
jgi:hypothetical protein